jgi:hypothetical protein
VYAHQNTTGRASQTYTENGAAGLGPEFDYLEAVRATLLSVKLFILTAVLPSLIWPWNLFTITFIFTKLSKIVMYEAKKLDLK